MTGEAPARPGWLVRRGGCLRAAASAWRVLAAGSAAQWSCAMSDLYTI